MPTLLVTGGAGFIGANFVRFWRRHRPDDRIVVLDILTYAGNLANLPSPNDDSSLTFVHGDICDATTVGDLFRRHNFETVVHFAAESHVDRSILSSRDFIRTNVEGTHTLLECALEAWRPSFAGRRFHHISTDEVYGSLGLSDAPFTETTRYDPRSPYAASKAASDMIVRSYFHTHGLPTTISNSSNNYGPYQFPEKLIPLMIVNALSGKSLPIYGDGGNIRDWLQVEDHCRALAAVLEGGSIGETYNIGGGNEMTNLDLVKAICNLIDDRCQLPMFQDRFPECPPVRGGKCRDLITFVKDRPGHDLRYAVCSDKLAENLGWRSYRSPNDGMAQTVDWYIGNENWWRSIQTGEYRKWIELQYGHRT